MHGTTNKESKANRATTTTVTIIYAPAPTITFKKSNTEKMLTVIYYCVETNSIEMNICDLRGF